MNIERKNIYAGIVCRKIGFLTCEVVRGIIFEKNEQNAIDLVNGVTYKIEKSKELCVPNGMIISLDEHLKCHNYKENLDEESLNKFINEDFSIILKQSKIYEFYPFLDEYMYYNEKDLTEYHLGFELSEIENPQKHSKILTK